MKKLFTLKNVLICILFTIFLLFVKDNFSVVWNAICMLASILTPFVIGFLFAYILNFPYKFFYSKVFGFLKNKKAFFAKMRKPLSIICTYTAVIAVLGFLIAILVPQIGDNISSRHNLIQYMNGFQALPNGLIRLIMQTLILTHLLLNSAKRLQRI